MYLPRKIRQFVPWFSESPEESLEKAYQAALMIKLIEDEYFEQQPIQQKNSSYSDEVFSYFEQEVNRNLRIVGDNLKKFKESRSFLRWAAQDYPRNQYFKNTDLIIEKLNVAEDIISTYEKLESGKNIKQPPKEQQQKLSNIANQERSSKPRTISDQTSVLPRSLLRTLNRIKREVEKSSDAEEEVIRNFRSSRDKTAISIRFLLILIIVPLLTHQITKNFIIAPIAEHYFVQEDQQVLFINRDFREEALQELQHFEETLRFEEILGMQPEMSEAEMEEKVREKAREIAEYYRYRSLNAIENIIADICSVIAFTIIIYRSREEIAVLKSFIDEFVYGLSDSAKAFIIILSTDIFVGYHSPHGWEVILEQISRHFGLPENREFNFIFIATFPVILDTIFKYWIFRYLNRISPSAVATYRNMNE
ncbi:proton extrusion protein PcxA [Euhalothece natronophila Z-M001]|uniref:Proton extrusion protein PxcA n=1 Tax=Euhalothece natronophila Z-M001 TaxID=522448 RepID=A0A5B8NJD8_9CHRO|nr:proton extrusion protein PcxA [Euhalothece natronophila]QDZ39038.1 proton extrusion protein PcxA [Euhalothece natronophila Z-M001]